jgi:hypothetical protein
MQTAQNNSLLLEACLRNFTRRPIRPILGVDFTFTGVWEVGEHCEVRRRAANSLRESLTSARIDSHRPLPRDRRCSTSLRRRNRQRELRHLSGTVVGSAS